MCITGCDVSFANLNDDLSVDMVEPGEYTFIQTDRLNVTHLAKNKFDFVQSFKIEIENDSEIDEEIDM